MSLSSHSLCQILYFIKHQLNENLIIDERINECSTNEQHPWIPQALERIVEEFFNREFINWRNSNNNNILLINCCLTAPLLLVFWVSYFGSFHYSVLKAYGSKYIFTAICASWLFLIAALCVHVCLCLCVYVWFYQPYILQWIKRVISNTWLRRCASVVYTVMPT